MKKAVLYIYGKGGSAEEAGHYRGLCGGADVIGVEYGSATPWEAGEEFPALFDEIRGGYDSVMLIANSIGAYFAMMALGGKNIEKALFISPVVDMEKLISDMMGWAGVTEEELCERGEIPTSFGETLSWDYLTWVRENPVKWRIPTAILYGSGDNLTSYGTISDFAGRIGASLTVMEKGEHWFHTAEEMEFLDGWVRENIGLDEIQKG